MNDPLNATKFMQSLPIILASLFALLMTTPALAEPENQIAKTETNSAPSQARLYRSPEERREAGLGRQINDWLTLSGLIEIEKEQLNHYFSNAIKISETSATTYTLQIGLDITFSESIDAELTFETERDQQTHTKLDEGLIAFDFEPWGIELGRLSVPFGEYYSHFVTGPLLEFGETLADALVFDYTVAERIEFSGYLLNSQINHHNKDEHFDWGINIEYSNEYENIKMGLGYLSDLAESDEQFLYDFGNTSRQTVSAWNAYALFANYPFEFTAEIVKANNTFAEFENSVNQPSAYNLEFAYFPTTSMQLAIRFERSQQYEEAPQQQWGINWTWSPGNNFLFSIEYFDGQYDSGFVIDDDDNERMHSDTFAAQMALEF